MDDPVAVRHQELRRDGDRRRIRDDPIGGLLQSQQDVDRDRARDQRIGVVRSGSVGVAREKPRLDVARDEKVAAKRSHEPQPRQRERNVELHLERGRSEHHAANRRCVVVDPGGRDDGADALRDDGDRIRCEAVMLADMGDERLHVAHRCSEARRVPARARRAAVTARIPREEIEVAEDRARRADDPCGPSARDRGGRARSRRVASRLSRASDDRTARRRRA